MSSPRFSTSFALLGVLLVLLPARIENSISNSTAPPAASHMTSASRPRPQAQEVLGYTLSPAQYARAVAYSRGEYWIYFLTTAYALLVLCAMIKWQLAPRLRDWAERNSRRAWVQFLLYAPTLLFVFAVLLLPTAVASQWHERKYGQSLQGWASWLGGWTTAEMVTLLLGTPIIALVYFAMRRGRHSWWLFLW